MKKLISLLLALVLLASSVPVCLAPTVAAEAAGQGDDYVFVPGENMCPVDYVYPFNSSYIGAGCATPYANAQEFSLTPPEGGVTVLILYQLTCADYFQLRQLFASMSTATWMDDPRVRVVAVNCGGTYEKLIEEYAGSFSDSVEWYTGNYNMLSNFTYFVSDHGYSVDGNNGDPTPFGMIISQAEMEGYQGQIIPAYSIDYAASYLDLTDTSVIENTLSHIFPDMQQDVVHYEPPKGEIWTVEFAGQRNYGYAQDAYDILMQMRTKANSADDMVLDAALTECAMQRAAELALYYSHTRPDDSYCMTVWDDMGYSTNGSGGENAAITVASVTPPSQAEQVMASWKDSPSHYRNMMDGAYNRVGIGCFLKGGYYYWVQLFDTAPYDGDALCRREDIVSTTEQVRTKTDRLRLKVRRTVSGEINKTVSYTVVHIQDDKDIYGNRSYAVCTLMPQQFDTVAKTATGATAATITKGADGTSLSIGIKSLETGYFSIKIAKEQKDAVSVSVTGQSAHVHHFTKWGWFKNPSCYLEGFERRECSCGYYETQVVPITHFPKIIPEIPATCSKVGKTEAIGCQFCPDYRFVEEQDIPKLPHTEEVFSPAEEGSCVTHAWSEGRQCVVCNTITQHPEDLGTLPHNTKTVPAVAPTCTKGGFTKGKQCVDCGKITEGCLSVPSVDHDWVTLPGKPATCLESGLTDGVECSMCHYVLEKQEKIPKTGHKPVNIPGKAPTCQAPGYSESVVCDDCGMTLMSSTKLPQRGHSYVTVPGKAATCKKDGLTDGMACYMCGLVSKAQEKIPKGAHVYSSDCDKSCNVCGKTRTNLTHTYSNGCDKSCNVCGKTRTDVTHDYKAATCRAPKTCKICGVTSGKPLEHYYLTPCSTTCRVCRATIKPKHQYSNACDTSCNLCKATRTVPGHKYKKVAVTKATTTKDGKYKNVCKECGYTNNKQSTTYKASKISLSKTSYTYNGKVQKPSVVVKDSKGNTITSAHYTVTYASGCKNAGTYKVTIKLKGNYSGTVTKTFKINPVDVSKCKITLSATSYTYNGAVKKPTVTVKNAAGTKLSTASYTVAYATGRKNVGTYKVTIKMKGNYTGTKTITFKILPAKTSISSLTAASKKLTVKWAKKTTQVSGYEIQYSTSKTFSSYKTKTITKNSTVSTSLTGLSAKKTYYVRIRTYKMVNGVKIYSGWSTVKSLKTK